MQNIAKVINLSGELQKRNVEEQNLTDFPIRLPRFPTLFNLKFRCVQTVCVAQRLVVNMVEGTVPDFVMIVNSKERCICADGVSAVPVE